MSLKIIIYIIFLTCTTLTNLSAQTLYLKAVGETQEATLLLETLEYQSTVSTYNALEIETQNIAKSLSHLGYLENDLLKLAKVNDSSYVASYTLGEKYAKVVIHYDPPFNKSILGTVSSTVTDSYFEITVSELETSLDKLNQVLSNAGDPFLTLQLANIKKADGTLHADLKIIQHPQRSIDSIIVKGYEKFPRSFVRHYLKLQTKQPFNLKSIKEKTDALKNLQFAFQIKEPEVLFTKDSTLLYLYVDKQMSNTFDGFLGFGTNTESSKIEFDGYLNLKLTNNLNFGESFQLLYKNDDNDQKTFDVKTSLPYLFGSPLGMELNLNIFKKDSAFVTTSQEAKIIYQINPFHSVATGIQMAASTNLLDRPLAEIHDYKSTFYTFNYQYSRPQSDDQLFPINFWFGVSTGIGKRPIDGTDHTQNKVVLDAFKIFNLNPRSSLYGHLNAALLHSDTYVENELFRFGGINSIRGFEENSLTANLYTTLITEYRYKLTRSLFIHTITDIAYYRNDNLDIDQQLLGLGFGFGILTQAGLFKLNYSNGSSKNRAFKFSNSTIHLSLTAQF